MAGNDLSIAANLLSATLQKDIQRFLSVSDAQQPTARTNNLIEAATVVFEELARIVSCIDDPVARLDCQLQLIKQMPDAVEGIRAAMLSARRSAK